MNLLTCFNVTMDLIFKKAQICIKFYEAPKASQKIFPKLGNLQGLKNLRLSKWVIILMF